MGSKRGGSVSRSQGVGVPFHNGAAEALRKISFELVFATKSDGVLNVVDEVVSISDYVSETIWTISPLPSHSSSVRWVWWTLLCLWTLQAN